MIAAAPLTIEQPAYFDRLAEIETRHWWSLGMWRLASHWLRTPLRGQRGLSALDVGCGTGQTALRLARRPEIDRVVGLDPSPEALEHAQRRHPFPLVRGSAVELPFADSRFDVVTCFDVLQHVGPGDDRRAIAELYRVLQPGGIALVRSNARARGRASVEGYRLHELIDRFNDNGFHVMRATYANFLPALLQEARGRLSAGSSGRTDRRKGARKQGHPAGGGLQIRLPHPWINQIMRGVSTVEAGIAGCTPIPLPYGHSTVLLARR